MSRPSIFTMLTFCIACLLGGSKADATALYLCEWTGVVQDIVADGDGVTYHFMISETAAHVACPQAGVVLLHAGDVGEVPLDVGARVFGSHTEINGDLRFVSPLAKPRLDGLLITVID